MSGPAEPGLGSAGSGADPVTVHVASAAPYDVVIGRGLLDELVPAVRRDRRRPGGADHPPTLAATAEAIRDALADAGLRAAPAAGAGRRGRART